MMVGVIRTSDSAGCLARTVAAGRDLNREKGPDMKELGESATITIGRSTAGAFTGHCHPFAMTELGKAARVER